MKLMFEALNNLLLHKTRSLLAVLGIVFGVASVICMLSISEVARQDVVKRIERMGIHNVILDTVQPEQARAADRARSNPNGDDEMKVFKYGLTRRDLTTLGNNLQQIRQIVPMSTRTSNVDANQYSISADIVGTSISYPDVMDHKIRDGRFLATVDDINASTVCVLGYTVARELFPLRNPIGQVIKIEGGFYDVVGVMEQKGETGTAGKLTDPDQSVFIPFQTAFVRRGLGKDPSIYQSNANHVEVNRAILQVYDPDMLKPVSQVASNMLDRLHDADDYSVTIPYSLLNEQKESEKIFRWVMGSLAAISLLVGGIGIMNIMLANATERKSEIGLRRALGAKRGDIVSLFVSESLLLCVFGGVLGVLVGFGLAQLIGSLAQWTVVYHTWSVPLGILVSAVVGLIFGTVPALRASKLDPVLALRSE